MGLEACGEAMDRRRNLNILDTHVWLWLMEGDPRIGDHTVTALEAAAASGALYVATLSLWEIAMYEAAGRLRFSVPVDVWLAEAIATPGLSLLEIDVRIAAESARLPGSFKGDLGDRLLVSAARTQGGTIYTADPVILEYGEAGFVETVAVV